MMLQVDRDLQEIASQLRPQGRTLRIAGLIALAVAVAAAATGLVLRWRHEAAVMQWTVTVAVPVVSFVAGDLVRIANETAPSGKGPGSGADAEENSPRDAKTTARTR